MWAHFASVAVHPSQLRITGYPHAYDMHIIKLCCCRQLQVDWQNIILCDLDRNIIKLPALGKISLWSTNDLESIEANIPYQIRVYGRVLDLVIPLEIKDDVHIKIIDCTKSPVILQLESKIMSLLYITYVFENCDLYTYILTYNKFIMSIYDYMYILLWGDYNLQI